MKRICTLAAAVVALGAFAGTAAADPSPTPNGLTGAANMVNANALPGMSHAMSTNNPNGRAGMWCAVDVTNGVITTPVTPGTCPQG